MTPETENPAPGSRTARLRILLPLALVAVALAVFLALFWHAGHDRKGHGHRATASRSGSPVGGQGDGGNAKATGRREGGSPVGGGPSRSASGGKGDAWWYRDGKTRRDGPGDDAWWAPKKDGGRDRPASGDESPVGGPSGGSARETDRPSRTVEERGEPSGEERPSRERDKPARASSGNPGEVAGQKGGPDDFWWRN